MLIWVYLAQQQYTQVLEALERFSAHLDRPGDIETTIEFLALQVVALYQAGKAEQARAVATRLLALTARKTTSACIWMPAKPCARCSRACLSLRATRRAICRQRRSLLSRSC